MPVEHTSRDNLVLRDQKILLDTQLAELYGVSPKALLEAIERNPHRLPEDFMFQLTAGEWDALMPRTSKVQRGGDSTLPYAFTDQGVAMLASVLQSDRAIAVNIQVVRVFARVRSLTNTIGELARRLTRL